MKFFYSAAVMGYGDGRWWHRKYNFPKLSRVTKSLTILPKIGFPFAVVVVGNSVWNRVSLHNIGFFKWLEEYGGHKDFGNIIVSLVGHDYQISFMVEMLEEYPSIGGIELNFSCPNVRGFKSKKIPKSRHDLYLKLRYDMDPFSYDLDRVGGIRINSITFLFGGGSGKVAQEKNWSFIKKFNKEGLNVAGCSLVSVEDITKLRDMGCKEVGLGSVVLTNPKLVERIGVEEQI